ncbi:hypothetical protein QCA50_015461 [Cerrena zonata]|uniref:Uncharacterized protein n=1 Tax=Cerrena zonata TaxID=2478898 RepID=A0AAW0FXC8_9APHY
MTSLHNDFHEPWGDHAHHHQRRRIAAVPDLRFEQSYLRSIRPYVRVEPISTEVLSKDEKGKGVAGPEDDHDSSSKIVIRKEEDIRIQWASVLWVTTKDQIISPLLQGALWGIAGYYLQPALATLRSRIGAWWARGDVYGRGGPRTEGKGVAQLRSWVGEIKQGKPLNTFSR